MELASFLGAHSPFQSMDLDEREALAAGSSFQDFAAGEIVTDYSSQVPDDIWMVCTGHVTLQSSTDGSTIDTVEPGGIFGYMPMLTGGGMGFVARATENSSLIRLPVGWCGCSSPNRPDWRSLRRRPGTPRTTTGFRWSRCPRADQ